MTTLALLLLLTPQAHAACAGLTSGVCDDLTAVIEARVARTRPPLPDPLVVPRGQITFDVEGNDNPSSRYYSRVLHWPGGASGVTIGRGYDMKFRTQAQVQADLIAAGVPTATAEIMAEGAGLEGQEARTFTRLHSDLSIGAVAQKSLFERIYSDYEDMTQSLVCGWAGESGAGCDSLWDILDPAIKTTLVDLRYRGDLTRGRWRRQLKSSVIGNNLVALTRVMSRRGRWSSVPADRFQRRMDYLRSQPGSSAAVTTSPVPVPRPDPRRGLLDRLRSGKVR